MAGVQPVCDLRNGAAPNLREDGCGLDGRHRVVGMATVPVAKQKEAEWAECGAGCLGDGRLGAGCRVRVVLGSSGTVVTAMTGTRRSWVRSYRRWLLHREVKWEV